ncbi:hypothetical protein C8Q80DRAFT_268517 [Daedaleopsis nitida]|nr:hypothetical protein C8Q80DRAFT_268517 [Daedaleopsis nitida]
MRMRTVLAIVPDGSLLQIAAVVVSRTGCGKASIAASHCSICCQQHPGDTGVVWSGRTHCQSIVGCLRFDTRLCRRNLPSVPKVPQNGTYGSVSALLLQHYRGCLATYVQRLDTSETRTHAMAAPEAAPLMMTLSAFKASQSIFGDKYLSSGSHCESTRLHGIQTSLKNTTTVDGVKSKPVDVCPNVHCEMIRCPIKIRDPGHAMHRKSWMLQIQSVERMLQLCSGCILCCSVDSTVSD